MFFLQFLLQVTTSLILASMANYWLMIPTAFMCIIFLGLRHIYVKTARCLKRLESMGKQNCKIMTTILQCCFFSLLKGEVRYLRIQMQQSPVFQPFERANPMTLSFENSTHFKTAIPLSVSYSIHYHVL